MSSDIGDIFLSESHMCQRENGCFVAWRNSRWSLDKLHGGRFQQFFQISRAMKEIHVDGLNRSFSVGLPNVLHDATVGYLHLYRLHLCNGVHSYFDHISVRIANHFSLSLSFSVHRLEWSRLSGWNETLILFIGWRKIVRLESTASVKRYRTLLTIRLESYLDEKIISCILGWSCTYSFVRINL